MSEFTNEQLKNWAGSAILPLVSELAEALLAEREAHRKLRELIEDWQRVHTDIPQNFHCTRCDDHIGGAILKSLMEQLTEADDD
jgi:hypothetical protein